MKHCWKCEFLDSYDGCQLCCALAAQLWVLELVTEHQIRPKDSFSKPPGVPDAPPAP